MARKRPEASHVTLPALRCLDGDRPTADGPLLTREEATALRRSAPLTHAKLTAIFRPHGQGCAPHDAFLAADEGAVS